MEQTSKTNYRRSKILLVVILLMGVIGLYYQQHLSICVRQDVAECPLPKSCEPGLESSAVKHWIIDNPNIPQDDPGLINYIRNFHLTPPSNKRFVLLDAAEDPKVNPSQYPEIMKLFRYKRQGGFFIEAGANDGLFISNTLQLEREYNWTGLLIEPNSIYLPKLRVRHRKAWIAGVCLSIEGYPQRIRFIYPDESNLKPGQGNPGIGIIEHWRNNFPAAFKIRKVTRDLANYIYAGPVECFPLYSLLLAVNHTVVDYFSIDVEGIELQVLKAIPFHLMTIKVLSIEYNLIPEGEDVLLKFLDSKGYKILFKRFDVEVFAAHKDYLHELDLSWIT